MMNELTQKLDQYIEEALFYYDLPGLAVSAVSREKDLDYKNAVGYRNFITKAPLKTEHIFHMASVSKLFTSSGIMMLCSRGELGLDDKLADVLPELSIEDGRYREITVRSMLTHTSGIADVEDYHWDTPRTDEAALRDYCFSDEVRKSPMLWSTGEGKFRYSNIAYELLGYIIEKKSGMPYEEYMKQTFLQPLGMKDSTFLTFERAGGSLDLAKLESRNMAMPHTKDEEKHIVMEKHYPYNREHGPSSTLTSNLYDLSRWADAHIDRKVFSPELYKEIWKGYATVPNNGEKMGLGWFMRKQHGLSLCGHEGTDDGFRASFWICPEHGIHVIVVSNLSGAPVKKIGKKLLTLITE